MGMRMDTCVDVHMDVRMDACVDMYDRQAPEHV